MSSQVPSDLLWEICRSNHAFLVKRRDAGGVQLSRDPLNLLNKHSKKFSGFSNHKTIGVELDDENRIHLKTKKSTDLSRPLQNVDDVKWGTRASGPKIYKGVVNLTTKKGYRADLRQTAVGRASALQSSLKVKSQPLKVRVRGKKASQ